MTEYVPVRDLKRLAKHAEADGDLFPDDTPANRLGHKFADDLRECIEANSVSENEVRSDE